MMRRRISHVLLFLLALVYAGISESLANAQNLAFDPGFVSLTAGDPTGTKGPSQISYSGPASGLVFSMNGVGGMAMATDSYGNVYVANAEVIWAIASGNGPIPVLPSAGPSPVAGNAYLVAGNGTYAGVTTPPCAAGTDAYGDGCSALQASISPVVASNVGIIQGGLATDSHNNLFLLESGDIRVIYAGAGSIPNLPAHAQTGYVYLIGGSFGGFGSSGDGGPALNATFNAPTGLSVDSSDNIYIADAGNYTVRVIYESGNVPNVPAGAAAGDIYTIGGMVGTSCELQETNAGYYFSSPCGDNGPATAAQLGGGEPIYAGANGISGVYVDGNGNIYINDSTDFRIRAIYASGNLPNVSNPQAGYIYTVAGNGVDAGYYNPGTGSSGPPPGADGPALNTSFANLAGITGDAAGNIYITDADHASNENVTIYNVVRRIDPAGVIKTLAPYAPEVCPDKTDVLGDGCPANAARISQPSNLTVDSSGNLFVSDQGAPTGLNLEVLHKISVNQTSLTAASTVSRPAQQVVTVTNTGAQPLQFSGIAYQGNNGDTSFSQASTGGQTDCSATTLLTPGASCQLGIDFTPQSVGTFSGAMVVASNALNASQGANLIQLAGTATQSQTTTNLSIVPQVANIGQQVTLTATVIPDYGSEKTPTGAVAFTTADGATTLGTANLTGGVATLTIGSLAVGTYSLKAAYPGDVNYLGSTSYPESLTVSTMQVPAVALTASSSAINSGQSVTLTASVTPYSGTTPPTGTITFQDGVVTLGSAPLNGSGVATFSTSILDIGSNSLVAVYSGDGLYATAVSTPVSVDVTSDAQLQLTPGIISDAAGVYNFNPYVTNYGGDGGPASAALMSQPQGVATDGNGNVYILDNNNFIVRAVYNGQGSLPGISNPHKGYIYLVAGTAQGTCSSSTSACGDGGPAIGAFLGSRDQYGDTIGPTSLAVDAAGNLYIGNGNMYRIRKVNASTGIITTIAGTGVQGYSGDGGAATAAQLASVTSIAVDNAGDVYFCDSRSFVIRRIDAISGVITTFAGNGTDIYTPDGNFAATASIGPQAIALDSIGNLYFVDGGIVRKIDAHTGVLVTVAGSLVDGQGYSGDGGLAIDAQLYTPQALAVDPAGNVYILDYNNTDVRVVNAISGIITSIVGIPQTPCNVAPCGDGGLATSANLSSPGGLALDPQGNVYIADTNDAVIREVPANPTAFDFGSQNQGTAATQTVTVTNTGGTLLILSGLSFSNSSFSQQSSGGTDCSSTTTLKAGEQCQIAISFYPVTTGAIGGTLTINSSASNASGGQTVISLKGTGTSLGGTQPQTITFPALPATINYGQTISLSAVASSGLPVTYLVSGPGKLNGATLTATGTGAITVTAYQFGQDQNGNASTYAAAAPVSQTVTAIGGVTLTVTASDESYIQGTPVPALAYTISGLENGDTTSGAPSLTTSATQTSPAGTYPIVITQGALQAPGAYQLNFVNGTMHVTGSTAQTIDFAPIGNITYGAAPMPLVATASSGDPVGFVVTSGPAQITGTAAAPTLTVTGAGPVTVTAMAYGDTTYKAATPVPQTITVGQHPLTITATNVTMTQGQPVPPLNTPGYTVNASQLVNGDTTAVLSGNPVLTTTATQNSPVGTYPIVIAQGTLTAANYTLSFVNGTLTIQQGQAQTVTFPPIANTTYGTGPITLGAGSSSNLPVTYSIQAGGGTNLASISGNTLIVKGAGQITVVATQPGNSTYATASAMQTFTVAPAVATITTANVTRVNNVPNPAFTGFSISGLVNGDTSSAISGTPLMTTTALPGSPVGTYPITAAQGTLQAANYTFNFVGGTLTITPGGPTPDFSLTASPQQLTMLAGQTRQSVIVLTPTNFYQGLVKLSCGTLPANVSCTFSPATLAPDGSGNPVQTALTLNTSSSSPVVGQVRPAQDARISLATAFYLPGLLGGLLLAINRRRLAKNVRAQGQLVVLLLLAGAIGLTACGGGAANSGNNGDAAPGTSTISVTVTGADNTSHTINLSITVE